MEQHIYSDVAETLYTQTLPNGLRVLVVNKPDYHETYALLATDYGAIDTRYVPVGATKFVQDPAGIAHFLEHKLFEKADHDAFDLFGATGANANAFTSTTRTAYLFSASAQVEKNLTILLDFVQDPYFTDKTVNKEKGIIGQEIQMYQDDPGWRSYVGLLGNLYPHHPASVDVTGTQASIAQITPAMLYQAHARFYHPSNMTLTVVGNCDPEAVLNVVAANQARKQFPAATPIIRGVQPDLDVVDMQQAKTIQLPVVRPKVQVGIKGTQDVDDSAAGVSFQIAARLLLEALFGDSSPLYQKWYDAGLVDDSFDYSYDAQRTFNFVALGGDVSQPQALIAAIKAVIARKSAQPELSQARFDRLKHAALGKYYMSMNSLSGIANALSAQSFAQTNLFDYGRLLQQVTLADVQKAAEQLFNLDAVTSFVIMPSQGGK
ncbi:EF-P 5-aminopentanol modification-associated protein YfmH [Lacticaseibacillus baoqingensis]|uniref:EF-P 5-aminopentanol modification-associated protein YfmH n=1 Tax=Lacticaseibacillus baoqingensis TaxID=2486013 RepID=A0ABW4E252_9LACO|nr:pitrilysin family protein [Lacticaseibacillus baoqingensis]